MATDDGDEVVIWPSFWRAYWLVTMPQQLMLWLAAGSWLAVVYWFSGFRFPQGLFPIPTVGWVTIITAQAATLLFGVALSLHEQLFNRVRLSVEGIRPPSGATLRGRMLYQWDTITGVELVERWYGRWLMVTTSRNRFSRLPVHVSNPIEFVETVAHFASPGNPLVGALRQHVCGWWLTRRPHVGSG